MRDDCLYKCPVCGEPIYRGEAVIQADGDIWRVELSAWNAAMDGRLRDQARPVSDWLVAQIPLMVEPSSGRWTLDCVESMPIQPAAPS